MSFKWDCSDFMLYPPKYSAERKITYTNKKEVSSALIVANTATSNVIELAWERAKFKICADGGANHLFSAVEDKNKYIPDFITGDLDSITPEVMQFYKEKGTTVVHVHDQDSNDLEKCLHLIESHESKHSVKFGAILVVGGLGGSFTHEMANCSALYPPRNRHIILWSEYNATWILDTGAHEIIVSSITKCGIIPMGSHCSKVTTTGLKWNLENGELAFGELVSTSNVTVDSRVTISVSSPVLWTMDFVH